MKFKTRHFLAVLAAALPGSSMGVRGEVPPQVVVSATDYLAASQGVKKGSGHVTIAPGDNWFSFDVEIPVAGRYRAEVRAQSDPQAGVVINLEDYIHNQDGRNYDITGSMSVPRGGAGFTVAARDGSPLNAGKHNMKLNARGGASSVQSITFTLIKPHELTPYVLKQNVEGKKWVLTWSDEFEKDGPPDPKVWAYDIGNWGWGNREAQYYTAERLENARCENGRLVVESRKDRPNGGWSSARLTTRGRVSFLYGRIEFSAKVPAGDGAWAAVWFLGDAYRDEVSWPYCGEIDILENVGREIDDQSGDGFTHFSCHTRAYYFKQGNHLTAKVPIKNLTGQFHHYAIEWTPKGISMFLDGKHHYTYDKIANELEFPFNTPQNLIVNMAMGGGMGGKISPELKSQKMELEYIRVYGRQ